MYEQIVNGIASLVLGIMPEVLYFTLFLIYTKNIKTSQKKLFVFISISYIACITIIRFKTIFYIGFTFLIYAVLRILYKDDTQIIDIFVFSISTIYLSFIGYLCSRFINNNYVMYYIAYVGNRILLFLPFIFKSKFNDLYKKYCNLWNRNYGQKQPIKSITLRNISLITLNSFIVLLNISTIYVINTFQ